MNFCTFQRLKLTKLTKFRNGKKGSFRTSKISQNWFHVKSEWQENPEISTLCSTNFRFYVKSIYDEFTVWKSEKITQWKKFRQINFLANSLVKSLISQNFWSKECESRFLKCYRFYVKSIYGEKHSAEKRENRSHSLNKYFVKSSL